MLITESQGQTQHMEFVESKYGFLKEKKFERHDVIETNEKVKKILEI